MLLFSIFVHNEDMFYFTRQVLVK